jgi:hypothetical protein
MNAVGFLFMIKKEKPSPVTLILLGTFADDCSGVIWVIGEVGSF